MPDIPKIARHRLQAMATPGSHPDADMLTAFLEKALPERERQPILEHLARCADCREVMSFSAPPAEAATLAPSRTPWLTWPTLRWAAAAACVVVVGAAVTLHYRDQGRMASSEQGKIETFSEEKPAAADKTVQREARLEQAPARAPVPSSPAQRTVTAAPVLTKQANQLAAQKPPAPATAKLPDVAAMAQTSAGSAPAPSLADRDEGKMAVNENVEVETSAYVASKDAAEPAPGKAKEALAKSDARASMGALAYKRSNKAEADALVSATGVLVVPRWTLSADGTLQRSLDGGRNWATVPVAGDAKFRALAAVGQEIWVGGSAGALYHSLDAGSHWRQVKPVAGDKLLTADIIGVEFTDSQHGKLTTTGETWLTSDGGQRWTQQSLP
jgi:photosynthesis system II assembly factor YCF48-like protein/putative zinc finger protein